MRRGQWVFGVHCSMNELTTGGFVGYIGPPEIHDGTIYRVYSDDQSLTVVVIDANEQEIRFHFVEVDAIDTVEPDGMFLYGLLEMEHEPPFRRFVFVNWDDEDTRRLEVVSKAIEF